ncbi:MAG TPA: TIGR00374 family protein, partial [Bifidobacterium pullorum]|nr:TIGR00374 family protein [Bifidobacterium pullorum]
MSEEHTKRGNPQTDGAADGSVVIDDIPPRRTRDFADLMHAVGALVLAVLMLLVAVYLRGLTTGMESDVHNAGQAIGWVMDVPASLLQQIITIVIAISVLFQLLVNREWLQSAISLIAMFGGYAAVWALSSIITLTGFDPLIQGLESPGALSGSGLV